VQPDTIVLVLSMPGLGDLDRRPRLSGDLEGIVLSGKPRTRARCQELHRDVTVLPMEETSLLRLVAMFALTSENARATLPVPRAV
jgi:hypothetical protein